MRAFGAQAKKIIARAPRSNMHHDNSLTKPLGNATFPALRLEESGEIFERENKNAVDGSGPRNPGHGPFVGRRAAAPKTESSAPGDEVSTKPTTRRHR